MARSHVRTVASLPPLLLFVQLGAADNAFDSTSDAALGAAVARSSRSLLQIPDETPVTTSGGNVEPYELLVKKTTPVAEISSAAKTHDSLRRKLSQFAGSLSAAHSSGSGSALAGSLGDASGLDGSALAGSLVAAHGDDSTALSGAFAGDLPSLPSLLSGRKLQQNFNIDNTLYFAAGPLVNLDGDLGANLGGRKLQQLDIDDNLGIAAGPLLDLGVDLGVNLGGRKLQQQLYGQGNLNIGGRKLHQGVPLDNLVDVDAASNLLDDDVIGADISGVFPVDKNLDLDVAPIDIGLRKLHQDDADLAIGIDAELADEADFEELRLISRKLQQDIAASLAAALAIAGEDPPSPPPTSTDDALAVAPAGAVDLPLPGRKLLQA